MGSPIFSHLETLLNSLVPAVEAVGHTQRLFSLDEFKTVMDAFTENADIDARCVTSTFYDLGVKGSLLGKAVVLHEEAKPEMYKDMRFRIQASLGLDGRVRLRVFEHVVGLPKERRAVKQLYAQHVEYLLRILDDGRL